jgi:hypothetical protein
MNGWERGEEVPSPLPQQRRSLTHTQAEVIERVLVDDSQLRPQGHCKFHHGAQMTAASLRILVIRSTHHDGPMGAQKKVQLMNKPTNRSP